MRKDNQIIIQVERPIKDAFSALAAQQGLSESRLARSMVIEALLARGLLPDTTLERLVV